MAEEVATRTEHGTDRMGAPSDTRGLTQTLYRTEDGRYLVFVLDWSHWIGEPDVSRLSEASIEALGPMGVYAQLGAAAGLG